MSQLPLTDFHIAICAHIYMYINIIVYTASTGVVYNLHVHTQKPNTVCGQKTISPEVSSPPLIRTFAFCMAPAVHINIEICLCMK